MLAYGYAFGPREQSAPDRSQLAKEVAVSLGEGMSEPAMANLPPETAGRQLRDLIIGGQTLVLAGVFDALSARLALAAGFRALYMSGAGVSASRAALPDNGLLTMTEMSDEAEAIVSATNLPVLADADTGYGDSGSVRRTVRRYERAGVGGMHIEDLTFPKHGVDVVSRIEMVERVEAALAARTDPSLMIVGRTDSLDTLGLDEAMERARMLESIGVDAVFVHGLSQRNQFDRVRKAISVPLVANLVEDVTEVASAAEVKEAGYEIAIFSISALRAAMKAAMSVYGELVQNGRLSSPSSELLPLNEVDVVLRLSSIARRKAGSHD